MQSMRSRPMQGSVNLANLGLQEFRLARGMGQVTRSKSS
jgi:hypothetical protein